MVTQVRIFGIVVLAASTHVAVTCFHPYGMRFHSFDFCDTSSGSTPNHFLAVRFVKGKDSVFGPVSDSWFRFEEQGRGSLHLHLLLWLEKPESESDSTQSQEDVDDNGDPIPRWALMTLVTLRLLWVLLTFALSGRVGVERSTKKKNRQQKL